MADLLIEQCVPSARLDDLTTLFERGGRTEFAEMYDRVYRSREAAGLRSWLGSENGHAVLHISVSPQAFSDGTQPLTGGMLADLMADESHRDFWNPTKLVRRMVADVKAQRMADFLFTTTVAAAKGVFRAAGFKPFATIQRYVMPARWPYPLLRRLQHGQPRPPLTTRAFDDPAMHGILAGFRPAGFFRTVPDPDYYTSRMPRWSYPAGTWLIAGDPAAPDALVLVSPTAKQEMTIADLLVREDSPGLTGLFAAAASWAGRQGFRQLSLATIANSRFAARALRAGFLDREQGYGLYVHAVNTSAALPPSEDWLFTPFVLNAW